MKGFALGVFLTILVGGLFVYAYFAFGMAPVATSAPMMPFEKQLARLALQAHLRKEMTGQPPMQPDEANLVAGAHLYLENCAVCHGLPGKEQTAIALGEFPKPPHLLRGKGVTDDEPGETYWKVANGIRLTGMPAYDKSLSSDQMWQVSLLLANADKLPPSVMAILSNSTETPARPDGGGH